MDAQSLGLQSFSRIDINSPLEMANKIEQFFNTTYTRKTADGQKQMKPFANQFCLLLRTEI